MNISKFPKLLFIFLISLLILITTAGVFVHAEASMEKKHMALAWHKQSNSEKLVKTIWITIHNEDDYQQIKEQLDQQPEGYRTLLSWNLHEELFRDKKDYIKADNDEMVKSIWYENGAKVTKEKFNNFFKNLQQTGAKVDYLMIDIEGWQTFGPIMKHDLSLRAIAKDPRFKSQGWDKKLGMKDLEPVINNQGNARPKFEIIMNNYVGEEFIEKAIFEPIQKYYPNVILGNWFHDNFYDPQVGLSRKHIGNRSVPVAYGAYGVLEKTPFGSLINSVNSVRNSYITNPFVPITPWVAWHRFGDPIANYKQPWSEKVYMANTDLYHESIYHIGLTGVDTFLFWNPRLWGPGGGPCQKKEPCTMPKDEELMNDLLVQLDEIVGYKDTVPIVNSVIDPDADFILTGMKIPHKNISIYRFTPELENNKTLESSIVSYNPLTFQTATKTIVFKKGKILRPKKILSKQGYWITTSEEEKPIIKNNNPKKMQWWKNLMWWKSKEVSTRVKFSTFTTD